MNSAVLGPRNCGCSSLFLVLQVVSLYFKRPPFSVQVATDDQQSSTSSKSNDFNPPHSDYSEQHFPLKWLQSQQFNPLHRCVSGINFIYLDKKPINQSKETLRIIGDQQ